MFILFSGTSNTPDSKRNRAPAFSFGSRHGNKNESPGPGPGQYNVTGLSAKGEGAGRSGPRSRLPMIYLSGTYSRGAR